MKNTELLTVYLDYIKELNSQVQKHKRINLNFVCQGITTINHLLRDYKFNISDIKEIREFNKEVESFIKTSKSKLDDDFKDVIFFNIKNLKIPC